MDKTPPPLRAAFFDIGNVLVRFDVARVLRRIAAEVGRNPLGIARLVWKRRLVDGVERGEITAAELFRIFKDELGFSGDYARFLDLWCDNFSLDRKAASLMRRVAGAVPVYLLSNTNRPHYEYLRARYKFPAYARGAVLSYRLGLRKPEEAIYRKALERAGAAPEEALFVDDSAANVAAARRLGIRAVLFTGADALEAELRELGLLRRTASRKAG